MHKRFGILFTNYEFYDMFRGKSEGILEGIELRYFEELTESYKTLMDEVIKRALRFVREKNNKLDDKDSLLSQIKVCNEIIKSLSKLADESNLEGFKIAEEGEILTVLYSKINSIKDIKAVYPVTPLSQSSLFTGSSLEPNMMSEIKKEFVTSDSIDLLISFVK